MCVRNTNEVGNMNDCSIESKNMKFFWYYKPMVQTIMTKFKKVSEEKEISSSQPPFNK